MQQALRLCDQALAAEQRLGPTSGSRLGIWSSRTPRICRPGRRHSRRGGRLFPRRRRPRPRRRRPSTRRVLSRSPRPEPLVHGPERGTTTRQHWARARTRKRHAPRDRLQPHRSRAGRRRRATRIRLAPCSPKPSNSRPALGYESHQELHGAVFCAARLDEWPTALGLARRVLHQHSRSGAFRLTYLAGMLNLVATRPRRTPTRTRSDAPRHRRHRDPTPHTRGRRPGQRRRCRPQRHRRTSWPTCGATPPDSSPPPSATHGCASFAPTVPPWTKCKPAPTRAPSIDEYFAGSALNDDK